MPNAFESVLVGWTLARLKREWDLKMDQGRLLEGELEMERAAEILRRMLGPKVDGMALVCHFGRRHRCPRVR